MNARKSQSDILLKYKGKKEQYAPGLDTALRRAAAFGNREDIDLLIHYGADINSQDKGSGHTALHVAVLYNKESNVKHLLSKNAKQTIKDNTKKRAGEYAQQANNPELSALIGNEHHPVFGINDLLLNILSSLSFTQLNVFKTVSFTWNLCVYQTIQKRLLTAGLSDKHREQIKKLIPELRLFIHRQIFEDKVEFILKLLDILAKNPQERKKLLYTEDEFRRYGGYSNDEIASDIIVTMIHCKLISKEFLFQGYQRRTLLNNKYAFVALSSELVTSEQLSKFEHSGSSNGTHDNLAHLLIESGLIALQENLITADDAPYISDLRSLLSESGLTLLREKLINAKQARGIYHSGNMYGPNDNLSHICTKNGIALLRNKYLTPEQITYISFPRDGISDSLLLLFTEGGFSFEHLPGEKIRSASKIISCSSELTSEFGLSILKRKMFDPAMLESLSSSQLIALFTPECIKLIDDNIIAINDITAIQDLKELITPAGIQALKDGVLTIKQAKQLESLSFLQIQGASDAIKEGLILVEDFSKFRDYNSYSTRQSLSILFSEPGLLALREKLITINDAITFYHSGCIGREQDNLKDLLTPLGIQALREKLIDPSKASCYKLDKLFKSGTPKILKALKLGVIQIDDFCYKGRFYSGLDNRDFQQEIDKLVPDFSPQNDQDITDCVTLQKFIRSYQARNKLGLFITLSEKMRTSTIHQLNDLSNAKTLIDENKFDKASSILKKL